MHHRTKKKLDYLRLYIQRHFKRWHQKYPNISGAYPGEKYVKGEPSGKYSIVFLVSDKQKKPSVMIPPYLTVTLPGEGKKKIPTDVIKMEKFSFRTANPGNRIKRTAFADFGSTGAFLTKGQDVFACSNSHVLLPDMISNGQTFFSKMVSQQITPDVVLTDQNGQSISAFMQEGHFDDIDAAIARLDDGSAVSNDLPGLGHITGVGTIQISDKGLGLTMLGLMSGRQDGVVNNIGMTLPSPIGSSIFHNLIEISIVTQAGDSGSPVVDHALQIVGMIIGGTPPGPDSKSYMIPMDIILDTFKCDILS